jgi:hypothetical protein
VQTKLGVEVYGSRSTPHRDLIVNPSQ